MKLFRKIIFFISVTTMVLISTNGIAQQQNTIQIALLLDTSSSMDGLINQAKSQLWKVVNELARAQRNGASPQLEVALFEYGNDSLPSSEGFIRMALPLSSDLDQVSEELFKLTTNGGSEYCGTVIDKAVKTLAWSRLDSDLKMIVIAGNEPFTQGEVEYAASCRSAIQRGIVVNTVFCGDHQEGIRTEWKRGADLADGSYMSINHNDEIVHIPSPYDEKITELGKELNKTYLAYGSGGAQYKSRQIAQDSNAAMVSEEVAVERTVSKSTSQYKNETWDMVDAVEAGKLDVAELDENELPEEMKKMKKAERKEYVEKLSRKREKIQKDIQELNDKRQKYITQKQKESAESESLDEAILGAVRKQAKDKNYTFSR